MLLARTVPAYMSAPEFAEFVDTHGGGHGAGVLHYRVLPRGGLHEDASLAIGHSISAARKECSEAEHERRRSLQSCSRQGSAFRAFRLQ